MRTRAKRKPQALDTRTCDLDGAGGGGRTRTVLLPTDFENCRQLCKSLQSFAVYSRLFPIFGALQALKIQTYENTGNAKNEKEVDLVEVW